jgi:hypothetical protein
MNNNWHFSPLSDLPYKANDVHQDYYKRAIGRLWGYIRRSDIGYSWPTITQDYSVARCPLPAGPCGDPVWRVESFVFHFHLKGKHPVFLNWDGIKPGSSIALFYPFSRTVQDASSKRIRQTQHGGTGMVSRPCWTTSKGVRPNPKCFQVPRSLLHLRFIRYPLQACCLLRRRMPFELLEATA